MKTPTKEHRKTILWVSLVGFVGIFCYSFLQEIIINMTILQKFLYVIYVWLVVVIFTASIALLALFLAFLLSKIGIDPEEVFPLTMISMSSVLCMVVLGYKITSELNVLVHICDMNEQCFMFYEMFYEDF